MINAARIVGPALAGLVVAKFGEGLCFVINAVSYLAVIAALLAMKLPHRLRESARRLSIRSSLIEGALTPSPRHPYGISSYSWV